MKWLAASVLALALVTPGVLTWRSDAERQASAITGGVPARGKTALRGYGCVACHQIPGVVGPAARVGPPLDHLARRQTLAGVLPNTADNLVHWVREPQHVVRGNAMPELNVSEETARDMAAYLYSLR
jgi:cytochrome c